MNLPEEGMPIGSHLMQPASVNMRSSDDVQLQRLRSSDEVRCNLCAFETRVMEHASVVESGIVVTWDGDRAACPAIG